VSGLPQYVYVASSWRNPMQPVIVHTLRAAGIDLYDFRNPAPGVHGFAWSEIDPEWRAWSADVYVKALRDPIAEEGFRRDFEAMQRADTFVLVLPCGRSAHLELGWAVGAGKRTAILTQDGEEPELMAKMVDHIATSVFDLLGWLGVED
jgi:nucleoside 2-deoxyribosyltransferase